MFHNFLYDLKMLLQAVDSFLVCQVKNVILIDFINIDHKGTFVISIISQMLIVNTS